MTLGEDIGQLYIFLVFFSLGALVSTPYFGLTKFAEGKLLSFVTDAVFCVTALFVLWVCNLFFNNGEFRLFVFVAFVAGTFASFFLCRRLRD